MDYYNGLRATNAVSSTVSSSIRTAAQAGREAYDQRPAMPSFQPTPAMNQAWERGVGEATAGWSKLRAAVWGEEEAAAAAAAAGHASRPSASGSMRRTGSSSTAASASSAVASTSKTVTGDGETRWGRLVATVSDASAKVSKAVNRDGGYGALRMRS
jgi:hypothetical protein